MWVWWVLVVGLTLLRSAAAEVPGGCAVELERLRQHPKRQTVELLSATGRSLGKYEALLLWDVVSGLVSGVPDTMYRELAVVVTAADGRRAVMGMVEVLPEADLPPLLLLGAVRGRVGDTVRVPVRAGAVALGVVDSAVAPAVRLRYRIRAALQKLPMVQYPALLLGTERQPRRWLSGVVRCEVVRPGHGGGP